MFIFLLILTKGDLNELSNFMTCMLLFPAMTSIYLGDSKMERDFSCFCLYFVN